MSQAYSDPSRADDPYALPNVEVFQIFTMEGQETGEDGEDGEPLIPGWYWQACFPGCLPDGEPIGPFASETEALADAQEDEDI
jgi:hypothetical protein